MSWCGGAPPTSSLATSFYLSQGITAAGPSPRLIGGGSTQRQHAHASSLLHQQSSSMLPSAQLQSQNSAQQQQRQHSQQQIVPPAFKPFSNPRLGAQQLGAKAGSQPAPASQQQYYYSSRPSTPPFSQGFLPSSQGPSNLSSSQPSQQPESDQLGLLPSSQQLSQLQPATYMRQPQQPAQQARRWAGSTEPLVGVPATARPGSVPAAGSPAVPASFSNLGKALGQELEGRKVLEVVEAMQVGEMACGPHASVTTYRITGGDGCQPGALGCLMRPKRLYFLWSVLLSFSTAKVIACTLMHLRTCTCTHTRARAASNKLPLRSHTLTPPVRLHPNPRHG